MKLRNYIKQNYKTPNSAILKALDADEELIKYLRHTPWNTNLNMLKSFEKKSPVADDVWFTGYISETDAKDTKTVVTYLTLTRVADMQGLIDNPANYSVSINGISLPYTFKSSKIFIQDVPTTEEYEPNFMIMFDDDFSSGDLIELHIKCPTQIVGDITVTITQKQD